MQRAERKNEDFMLRSLRKKPRKGKGMDVRIKTDSGYVYARLPERKPGESFYDYAQVRVFAYIAHCKPYWFTKKGKGEIIRMFPEIFSNNRRKMHGIKVRRTQLWIRRVKL